MTKKEVALLFNKYINTQDLDGLSALMADEKVSEWRVYEDTEGNRIKFGLK